MIGKFGLAVIAGIFALMFGGGSSSSRRAYVPPPPPPPAPPPGADAPADASPPSAPVPPASEPIVTTPGAPAHDPSVAPQEPAAVPPSTATPTGTTMPHPPPAPADQDGHGAGAGSGWGPGITATPLDAPSSNRVTTASMQAPGGGMPPPDQIAANRRAHPQAARAADSLASYYNGPHGGRSPSRIEAYQRQLGVPVDGIVGPDTTNAAKLYGVVLYGHAGPPATHDTIASSGARAASPSAVVGGPVSSRMTMLSVQATSRGRPARRGVVAGAEVSGAYAPRTPPPINLGSPLWNTRRSS